MKRSRYTRPKVQMIVNGGEILGHVVDGTFIPKGHEEWGKAPRVILPASASWSAAPRRACTTP